MTEEFFAQRSDAVGASREAIRSSMKSRVELLFRCVMKTQWGKEVSHFPEIEQPESKMFSNQLN